MWKFASGSPIILEQSSIQSEVYNEVIGLNHKSQQKHTKKSHNR